MEDFLLLSSNFFAFCFVSFICLCFVMTSIDVNHDGSFYMDCIGCFMFGKVC